MCGGRTHVKTKADSSLEKMFTISFLTVPKTRRSKSSTHGFNAVYHHCYNTLMSLKCWHENKQRVPSISYKLLPSHVFSCHKKKKIFFWLLPASNLLCKWRIGSILMSETERNETDIAGRKSVQAWYNSWLFAWQLMNNNVHHKEGIHRVKKIHFWIMKKNASFSQKLM